MHVAITGASSGIGAALAREYARAGAGVTLVARREELLRQLAAELGGRCHVAACDLADCERAPGWIAGAQAALGPIDVLVNNAGVQNTGPALAAPLDGALDVLRTNLEAPLRLTHALLPEMLARGGVLVNVASVAGLVPPPLQAWYGASKAGLAAFSEALAGELRGSRVHVLTVYPGPVKTAMADAAYAAFGGRHGVVGLLPEGRPEVLARRIRHAVERRRPRLVYPRFYAIARLFPWFGRWLVDRAGPRPYAR
jgi:short-subunit dehydrogenase